MILGNHVGTGKQQAMIWLESTVADLDCHCSNLGRTEIDFNTHCKRSAPTQISEPSAGNNMQPNLTKVVVRYVMQAHVFCSLQMISYDV